MVDATVGKADSNLVQHSLHIVAFAPVPVRERAKLKHTHQIIDIAVEMMSIKTVRIVTREKSVILDKRVMHAELSSIRPLHKECKVGMLY